MAHEPGTGVSSKCSIWKPWDLFQLPYYEVCDGVQITSYPMPRRLSTVIPFPFKAISSLSNIFHCGIILTVFFCKCVLTQIMQSKCIYLWSTTELDVVACSSNSVHMFLPYLVPFLNKSLQAYFCFFLCSSHGLVSRCPHSVFRDISAL